MIIAVLPLLVVVPVFTSLILGIIYLALGNSSPLFKLGGVMVFAIAAWLQFGTTHVLAGMLVQIGLAVSLAVWKKSGD